MQFEVNERLRCVRFIRFIVKIHEQKRDLGVSLKLDRYRVRLRSIALPIIVRTLVQQLVYAVAF